MDETMVSSSKKFKVYVTKGRIPLTAPPINPHITACITIGANGNVFKPLFILPNKKKLGELKEFEGKAYFASSLSGWMNAKIFTYWALTFLAQISIYRLELPPELRNQRILLLLDGHRSRINYFVSRLFDFYGIDILIFPGHTSHILQAFDVSVASPLKCSYKRRILKYDITFDDKGDRRRELKKTQKEIRIMMIRCLLDALAESATLSNIQSGFRASGICPVDQSKPLSSKFATDSSLRTLYPELYSQIKGDNLINNRHLNGSLENLAFLFQVEYQTAMREQDLLINIETVRQKIQLLIHSKTNNTVILSAVPDIFEEKNGTLTRISLN